MAARMTIKAWLEGDLFDLQDLADLLPSGDVRVVREGDAFYLTAPEIDDPPEEVKFYDAAACVLDRINGLGRVKNPSFRPVTLSGRYGEGESQHLVVTPSPAEIRIRTTATVTLTKADGTVIPDEPSPWPGRFALAETNSDVAKILEIMGSGEKLDWFDLFKIYELIDDALGSDTIVGHNWSTSAQDSAFRASANLAKVSGDAARHAVDKGSGYPKHTMTIDQGRSFISDLVTKWLGTL
jgi:hypothetical protein